MKIAVYRSALISVLDRVMRVMPSSKVSPILNYVLMVAEDDHIDFTATDLSNFITVRVKEVKIAETGRTLIPAADLYAATKNVSSEGLVISTFDSGVQLKSGKTAWNWKVFDEKVFPKIPFWEQSQVYTLDCKSFVSSLRRVKPAAARQSFSTNLEQIGFIDGNMIAADGSRFHQVFVEDSSLDIAFPLSFVDDLISVLSSVEQDKFEIGITKNKDAIVIQCSDFVLSSKTKTEKFPDVKNAFLIPSMKNYIEIKCSKRELIESVKRVQITSNKDTRAIKMILSSKDTSLMTLFCTQLDGSYSSDTISIAGPLENREITVSIEHLVQGLNVFSGDSIVMLLAPDQKNKPSTVLIQDGKDFAVLNQLRVS